MKIKKTRIYNKKITSISLISLLAGCLVFGIKCQSNSILYKDNQITTQLEFTKTSTIESPVARNNFSKNALDNSTNSYREFEDYENGESAGIIQYTLEGKELSRFTDKNGNCIWHLLYVEEDGLILKNEILEKKCEFYYLPLTKTEQGDEKIDITQKKLLFSCAATKPYYDDDDQQPFVNENFIICFDGNGRYIRYNRQTGEKYTDFPLGKIDTKGIKNITIIGGVGNTLFTLVEKHTKNTLYQQELSTMKWTKLLKKSFWNYDFERSIHTDNSTAIIAMTDNTVVKEDMHKFYKITEGESNCQLLLSGKKIIQKLLKEKLIRKNEKDLCTTDIFWVDNGRVYIQCQIGTIRRKIYQSQQAILSIGIEDKELHYEKDLTEYMLSCGVYRSAKWKAYRSLSDKRFNDGKSRTKLTHRINAASCYEIENGKVLFFYEASKNKVRAKVYNLSDNNTEKFSKKNHVWWYYDWHEILTYSELPYNELCYYSIKHKKWIYEKRCISINDRKTHKINGSIFQAQKASYPYHSITMKKNGKTDILANKTDKSYITDGNYLYYTKIDWYDSDTGDSGNNLYEMNIHTKKKRKLIAGCNMYLIKKCNSYIYYKKPASDGKIHLFVYDLKTQKHKQISKNVTRFSTQKINGRICCIIEGETTWQEEEMLKQQYGEYYSNYSKYKILSFALDGSNRQELTDWEYSKTTYTKEYWNSLGK